MRNGMKANIILMATTCVIALVLLEIGARIFYYSGYQRSIAESALGEEAGPMDTPSFSVAGSPALWVFNETYGWDYRPGGPISARIKDGRFAGCSTDPNFNDRGNIGRKTADYENADIKVLFAGSSFTMGGDPDGFIHDHIERRMEQVTGQDVEIENFARDSYGLTQMFDLIADWTPRIQPDLIVLAFNTTDLVRRRTWRFVIPDEEGFSRFYQSISPEQGTLSPETAILHRTIISDQVTPEWCDSLSARVQEDPDAAQSDPTVRSLVAHYRSRAVEQAFAQDPVDFWTLRTSFVVDAVLYGDPFHKARNKIANLGEIKHANLALDARFVRAVETIRESGTPLVLVHVPAFPEIETGEEWVPFASNPDDLFSLVESLQRVTEEPIHSLRPYYLEAGVPPEDTVQKAHQPNPNWHPSHAGMRIIARGIADLAARRLGNDPTLTPDDKPAVSDNLLGDTPLEQRNLGLAYLEFSTDGETDELGKVYRFDAVGPTGEHYWRTRTVSSPPGAHSFSVWVDTESADLVRLQLQDSEGNGAAADFDLKALTRITYTGEVIATSRFLEQRGTWVRISLSINTRAPELSGVVQLARQGAQGQVLLPGGKDSLRFTQPVLEQGFEPSRSPARATNKN